MHNEDYEIYISRKDRLIFIRFSNVFEIFVFRKGIGTLLFTADSIFQDTLLKIRHDCESVCTLYPQHGHDRPQTYISLLDYDPGHTYRLQEFCELQLNHFQKAAGCVKSLRDNIRDLVKITCEVSIIFKPLLSILPLINYLFHWCSRFRR